MKDEFKKIWLQVAQEFCDVETSLDVTTQLGKSIGVRKGEPLGYISVYISNGEKGCRISLYEHGSISDYTIFIEKKKLLLRALRNDDFAAADKATE